MNYKDFLQQKKHSLVGMGFDTLFMPDIAFDFQKKIIQDSIKKGRYAIFADTGLGKTLIQISIAQNIVLKTNKRVLILTPLAVGFQFVKEAEKIGISDVYQTKKGELKGKIIICNYERLHYLNSSDFEGVILDESSILKNFEGKIKESIINFIKKVNYRFLSSATPSPNDFIELGNSSEALGYMGYTDMLGKFFKANSNSIDSKNRSIGSKFYLKPHATSDFFSWVNQWAIMCKMPSDLGFCDDGYVLPKLHINTNVVKNMSLIDANGQINMFTPIAKTMTEVKHEQKCTEKERCEKAYQLAEGKTSVYWCNTNNESQILKGLDKEAVEIKGSQSIEQKEEILISFSNGDIKRLITKPKMTSMGLNWQHCNHSVFFPSFSYEQFYQSVRRFWRFGQSKEVTIDLVVSDGQSRVLDALEQKKTKQSELYENLKKNKGNQFNNKELETNLKITLPNFI